MDTTIVGSIEFDRHKLNVYSNLDEPLFRAQEIAEMLEYSTGNNWNLTSMLEEDEKLRLPTIVAGQKRVVLFVTENGLYDILAQSRVPLARKWRRIIHNELIELRKIRGWNIEDQFESWDHQLDGIYYDEQTGFLMQSVTTVGGDVEQVAVKEVG